MLDVKDIGGCFIVHGVITGPDPDHKDIGGVSLYMVSSQALTLTMTLTPALPLPTLDPSPNLTLMSF